MEQIGSGKGEPAPTPAIGEVDTKTEEVDVPGGLDKVDEELKEASLDDDAGESKSSAGMNQPIVTEEGPKEDAASPATGGDDDMAAEAAGEAGPLAGAAGAVKMDEDAAPVRAEERIENPTYTLEIVGNRYNPNNFW